MEYALIELDWGDIGWMLGLLGAAIALPRSFGQYTEKLYKV